MTDWTKTDPAWFDSTRPMSLGMMLPVRENAMGGATARFDDLVAMGTMARDVGFETLWIADHVLFETDGTTLGAWEAWTTMAALAIAIPGIQIGPLVTCMSFRNPALLAKMAESMDELSGGRFILGLGAGWHEPEYRRFGWEFDYRASRFEEAMEIIRPMLREGTATISGAFHRADDAINRPRGPRQSGVPILIGSNGDRLVKTVARHADAWNSDWLSSVEELVPLMAKLDAACDAIGRPRESLIRTASARFAMDDAHQQRADLIGGSAQDQAHVLGQFRDAGIRHFVCGLEPRTLDAVERFGDVIAALDRR